MVEFENCKKFVRKDINLNDLIKRSFVETEENDKDITLFWNLPEAFSVLIYKKNSDLTNGLFRLAADINEEKQFWIDEDVFKNTSYEYKITSPAGKILSYSKVDFGKDSPFFININSLSNNGEIAFEFNIETPTKLNWRLLTAGGESLISQNSWYNKGVTIEKWNGITSNGNIIKNGVYTFYCFSETFLKEFTQKVIIEIN